MGQLVQVEGLGLECVDIVNNQPTYIQWPLLNVHFVFIEISEW
jgi:hypothetical protein